MWFVNIVQKKLCSKSQAFGDRVAVSTQPLWCKTSRKCLKQVDATGEKKIFANQSLFQVAKAHTKFIRNLKISWQLILSNLL